MKFHIIMASYNRKNLTRRAIVLAQLAAEKAGIQLDLTVFDDGSSDGTAEMLRELSGSLHLLRGDGTAFWAKSMALAEAKVLSDSSSTIDGEEEYLVWLNDDVALDLESFAVMRPALEQNPGAILVGAVRDPHTDVLTYSGLRHSGRHPLSFAIVEPKQTEQNIDTFNGNLVVIPMAVAHVLGGIDGGYSHALADIDYGLRAARIGVPVLLASGTYGTCPRNPPLPQQSTILDWKAFTGTKGGGNFLSIRRVLRKSNRYSWLFFVASTYSLWWARRLVNRNPVNANSGR